jgi:hypothetical protein
VERVVRLLACLVVIGVLAIGCGDGGDGPPELAVPSTGATPSAVPESSPAADPAVEALAAYEAMWKVYDEAAQDPQADPQEAGLERYATGDALAVVTDLLASLREDGLVARGSIDHSPEVTRMSPVDDPTRVRVEDCADSSDRTVERADGGPYDDDPGGLRLIFADVANDEGMWKVTTLGIGQVGSCRG